MKIVCTDGTAKHTKVFTDSGEDISNKVRSISVLPFGPSGVVSARFEFVGVELDLQTKEWRTEPPTEPGWYWVKAADFRGDCICIVDWLLDDGTGKPRINWGVSGPEWDAPFNAKDVTHWLGPLPEPEMPE